MEWDLVCPGRIQVSLPGTVGPKRLSWMHVGGSTNLPPEHGSLRLVGWIVRRKDRCRLTVPPTCERHADPLPVSPPWQQIARIEQAAP